MDDPRVSTLPQLTVSIVTQVVDVILLIYTVYAEINIQKQCKEIGKKRNPVLTSIGTVVLDDCTK
jgi:hypothetical protein